MVLLVATAYLVGVLLPATRTAFLDARYQFGVSEALLTAFVVIPLGTILLEEVAFRSVLWGMLSRHMGTWRVLLVSSSLFGLWHVFPSLSFASANRAFSDIVPTTGAATAVLAVAGTVLFTGLGGVVAGGAAPTQRQRPGQRRDALGDELPRGPVRPCGVAARRLTAAPVCRPLALRGQVPSWSLRAVRMPRP